MILQEVCGIPVTWVGCHPENRFDSDDGLPKQVIVEHIAEGTLAGADSWFWNPRAKSTTNFMVSKQGEIHQYVKIFGEAPFANGVDRNNAAKVAKMDPHIKALWQAHGWANLNKLTLSIEHEGFSGEQITQFPAMFDASAKLTATLAKLIGKSGPDVTAGHYQFDAIDRPHCPGWTTVTWKAYDDRVQELIGAAEHGPISPAEPILTVQPSDWKKIKATLDAAYDAGVAVEQAVAVMRSAMSEVYAEIRRQLPNAV